jgi:glycosyltransferase involved in cell wall biosynthesis
MRIAFTHAFCWPEVRRGAERFIQELGAALVERGHDVTILSSGWDPGTTVLDGVTTVRLRRRKEDDRAHEADIGRRLLVPLVRGRFDAVHSMGRHDAVASIRAARVRRDRRTVITDLGIPWREYWQWIGRRDARAVETVVAGIDVYSCMSRWALEFLARDYGRTDGVVVPGGVDTRAFVPAPARSPEPTILFSGIFTEPRKGTATLLRALPIVAEREPGVRLQLSGPGDAAPLLAAAPPEAVERTEVLGTGDPKGQHERYGRAWVTCLPSRDDSFGMALVESLACGTPLVTSTEGAPPELVDPGVTGEVCRYDDPDDLAAALLRAFDLARRPETVERCRASAAPFDWRTGLAPLVEALYRG